MPPKKPMMPGMNKMMDEMMPAKGKPKKKGKKPVHKMPNGSMMPGAPMVSESDKKKKKGVPPQFLTKKPKKKAPGVAKKGKY